jgi:hypothetical protein
MMEDKTERAYSLGGDDYITNFGLKGKLLFEN